MVVDVLLGMARLLRITKSGTLMEDGGNVWVGLQKRVSFEKIGPQFVLLLFPAICAFVIILTGERLIFSDLAFIFGTILLIETIYFTYWGFNADKNAENGSQDDFPREELGIEFRLECPGCNRNFFVHVNKEEERIECKHCQFTGEIEGSESILENG